MFRVFVFSFGEVPQLPLNFRGNLDKVADG